VATVRLIKKMGSFSRTKQTGVLLYQLITPFQPHKAKTRMLSVDQGREHLAQKRRSPTAKGKT